LHGEPDYSKRQVGWLGDKTGLRGATSRNGRSPICWFGGVNCRGRLGLRLGFRSGRAPAAARIELLTLGRQLSGLRRKRRPNRQHLSLDRERIWITLNHMRTTLDLPEELVEEAQRILGVASKSDAVVLSLTEIVRRKRLEELKAMRGKIRLHVDIAASRRRPGRPSTAKGAGKPGRGR